MSIKDQTSLVPDGSLPEDLPDVQQEQIDFQILQGLQRVESHLAAIETRLLLMSAGKRGLKVIADKPNIRNWLNAQLTKDWISEPEILEKTGWQTIGVRSFITKSRKTLGLSVEIEERNGVMYYRFAR